jgi:large subunit ribosomal protein L7/L12
MADLAKIVDDLSSLTVLEAAELSKLLEEKWGVSAAAPVAVAAAAGGAPPLLLRSKRRPSSTSSCRCRRQEDRGHQGSPRHHRPGPQGSQGPGRRRSEAVKEGVNKADADKIKAQLEAAGAKVELK